MSKDRWEDLKNIGEKAIEKTIENNFDVIKTAGDLYEEYDVKKNVD